MLSDIEMEELEKSRLDYITTWLKQDIGEVLNGLNSRIELLNDWQAQFQITARKNYNSSDLDKGAERILHHMFRQIFKFPNSSPIGSDLMYKLYDSIIHIEVKTTLRTNTDYKGKVQLGKNQLSYGTNKFKPSLPKFYSTVKLPTLTYVIQIVHEHMQAKINALNVICIPNGHYLVIMEMIYCKPEKEGGAKLRM